MTYLLSELLLQELFKVIRIREVPIVFETGKKKVAANKDCTGWILVFRSIYRSDVTL